ncbi:MAG: DUF928 domain-containing protein [Cyanobacteria bacterium J06627_28]
MSILALTLLATSGMAGSSVSASVPIQNHPTKVERPRPPRRLPPNRVQPGGGLDEAVQACEYGNAPLTALVPLSNPVYTASAYPTFLFHFPDEPEAIAYAEFILLSADEKEQIYTTRFTPTQSGIIHLSIPTEAAYSLDVGGSYHWYLNLHCQTTVGIPSVNGWVQRIAAPEESSTMLTDTDLPEIWYDAIARTAAALATDNTPDPQVRASWQNWLSAVGLDHIADLPLSNLQLNNQSNVQSSLQTVDHPKTVTSESGQTHTKAVGLEQESYCPSKL